MYLHAYDFPLKGSCRKNLEEEKGQKFMTAHACRTNNNHKTSMIFKEGGLLIRLICVFFPFDFEEV